MSTTLLASRGYKFVRVFLLACVPAKYLGAGAARVGCTTVKAGGDGCETRYVCRERSPVVYAPEKAVICAS